MTDTNWLDLNNLLIGYCQCFIKIYKYLKVPKLSYKMRINNSKTDFVGFHDCYTLGMKYFFRSKSRISGFF